MIADMNFSGRHIPHATLQGEASECAIACLVWILKYHGCDTDLPNLRRRFHVSSRGARLGTVAKCANEMGLDARPLRLDINGIEHLHIPCILHWDMNHFVVLIKKKGKIYHIMDPAVGMRQLANADIGMHFTGVALELVPGIAFKKGKSSLGKRRSLLMLALPNGIGRAAAYVLMLAGFIELLSLLAPLFLQWLIDQVSLTVDVRLLATMGAAFVLASSTQCLLTILRGRFLSRLSAMLGAGWATGLFSHLLRLPSAYFERRHIGDLLSRFNSVQVLQKTLSGAFIESIFDGLMSIVTLTLLFVYNTWLASVILIGFAAYMVARRFTFSRVRGASERQVSALAEQQSILAESIKGVRPIQIAGREHFRTMRYANVAGMVARSDLELQTLTINFSAYGKWLSSVQKIAVASLAAYLIMRNEFSAGMLVAFLSYADQFMVRAIGLADKATDFAMLSMHAGRVEDVAFEDIDSDESAHGGIPIADNTLAVTGLSFRYSSDEPWIFRNLSFVVNEGESVAIIGPSGAGKSTLVKLLLGLAAPTEGSIALGGVDVRTLGHVRHRQLVSAVLQDDTLFAGTIADNISFFDPDATFEAVVSAAVSAVIHADIMAMPMGYETQVGDMGSALSGGQRQRVLLARAFYRLPMILVLDEATSHLDLENERLVNAAIRRMRTTRIIIAHRLETINSADRVINLAAIGEQISA